MPIFSCSAILFDLDGVLVDSTRAVDREWREWAARKGVDGDAVMAIAHGVRTIEVIRRVAPQLDAETEAAAIENHEAHDQRGVTVMPGAADLLKSIPAGRWGVVTSGSRLLAQNRLRYCGLPVPDVLLTSDDVTNGKPHPEPYLKGAQGLGLRPEECLVIEDAPAGIEAARAARMRVVGMASTYASNKLSSADAVIKGFYELSVQVNEGSLLVKVDASLAAAEAKNSLGIQWPEGLAELEKFLASKGLYFQCRGPIPHSGGEIRCQYGNDKIAVRVSADRGIVWSAQISDVDGWADQWWGASEIEQLLSGNRDASSDGRASLQMKIIEQNWDEIVDAFAPQNRSRTHTTLKSIREERAKRLLAL
jgi:sugar-phosphatase